MQTIYNDIIKKIDSKRVLINEEMKKHTSFKVGGPADLFIIIKKIEELKYIFKIAKMQNIPITIIGNGTNILVRDSGIRGIVLKIKMEKYKIDGEYIYIDSGMSITKIANIVQKESLSGLEFAIGIPGTIGGAITMNAGAFNGKMQDVIVETIYMDQEQNLKILKKEEHEFEYRNSFFNKKKGNIIISTKIKLKKGNANTIKEKMNEILKKRKESQPLELPSAGSIFRRSDKYITAKLIEDCNLKGYNIKDAYVSCKHAGFIVNKGNAKAKDIIELIEYIKTKIKEKFNIIIETEIEILGRE